MVTSHSPPHSRHFREASGCAKQRASRQDRKRPCSSLTESKHRNELPGSAIKAHLHGLGTSKCVHTWEELQLCCHRNECVTLCSISAGLTEKKSLGLTLPNGQLLHTTRESFCQHEYLLNQATESKHLGSLVLLNRNYGLYTLCILWALWGGRTGNLFSLKNEYVLMHPNNSEQCVPTGSSEVLSFTS